MEILANEFLVADVLKIAAGEVLEDVITSSIAEIGSQINIEADLRDSELRRPGDSRVQPSA